MSTQTQPAAPDPDEPTAIVANKATPLAALAWSEDADDGDGPLDPLDDDRSTTFWLRLYAGTTAAVVLALGVVLWFVRSDRHHRTQAVTVPASSAPGVILPSAPPAAAPAPMPSVTQAPIAPPVAAAPPPEPTWGAPTSGRPADAGCRVHQGNAGSRHHFHQPGTGHRCRTRNLQ